MPKTIKTTATTKKLTSEIDLFTGQNIPKSSRGRIRDEVGELLKDQILLAVGKQSSPIAGEGWPGISDSYRAFKKSQNLPGKVNMEFSGNMLDALDVRDTAKGIEIGVFGPDAGKADSHNNFSGKSKQPHQRRFLPKEDQQFKSGINRRVNEIISDAVVDSAKITRADIKGVTTKGQLFDILGGILTGLNRSEIKESILRDEKLVTMFNSLNILRFLS